MAKIRAASIDDMEQVFLLACDLATSFKVERNKFDKLFQQCLTDQSSLVLVAEENERIVGYLLGYEHNAFFANGGIAGVEELWVVPTYRRNGIGKSLMNECEKWASKRDATLLMVCTRRAGTFYKSIGYEESATYYRKVIKAPVEQRVVH